MVFELGTGLYCQVLVMTQIKQTARKLYLNHKDNVYCNSLVIRVKLNSVVMFDTESQAVALGSLF